MSRTDKKSINKFIDTSHKTALLVTSGTLQNCNHFSRIAGFFGNACNGTSIEVFLQSKHFLIFKLTFCLVFFGTKENLLQKSIETKTNGIVWN